MEFRVGDKYILSDFEIKFYSNRVQFNIPKTVLTIIYQSLIIVGNLNYARYYFEEKEGFIEKKINSNDYKIFIKDMEIFPNSQDDWEKWRNPDSGLVGAANLVHGDYEYRRLWNSSSNWIEPIEFKEGKNKINELLIDWENKYGMMYFRTDTPSLDSTKKSFHEFLLLQMDEQKVEMFVGVSIKI